MLEAGDLVISIGDSWSDRYTGKVFMVLNFMEHNEYGNKWIILDHISGGTLIAYEDEVEKIVG
jgi:hypothetical protein